ncbi:MAG: hypothetical protein HY741_23765 [Chloroflexi bacterium]|nr:hypothetical protein [Chloroflexota bacterium]
MKVATYEGFVENGKVQLPENIYLPEKAKVYVIVPDVQAQVVPYMRSPRLVHPEDAKDFEKEIIEDYSGALSCS